MNLLAVQNALHSHFIHNETFIISRDLDGLDLDELAKTSDSDECGAESSQDSQNVYDSVKRDLVLLALKNIKESGMISDVNQDFWILNYPISQFSQNVNISPPVAEVIAETINQYREAFNDENGECNKLSIDEADISNLCNIIQLLLDDLEEEE